MKLSQVIAGLLLGTTLVFAQAGPAAKKNRDIEYASDSMNYDGPAQLIRMVGNVRFASDGATLTAPVAEYKIDKQIVDFQGGVKMVGKQSTATGKEMRVWYGETRGVLKGDVRIVSQNTGKAGGGKGADEPTVVLCQTLDYNWTSEEGVAKGNVKMRQGIKRAFADRAEIYQKRNEILLIGNVRVEQGDGDWLTAQRAIYDTEDQTVRAEGRVVAKTRLEPEKEEPAKDTAPAKKALPLPMLAEPAYQMLPMRDLPVVPLPWLDQKKVPAATD